MAIILPTQKTAPSVSIQDYTFLIYGEPKVGKSTFCASMENALFLKTEEGLKSLSTYEVAIMNWSDMYEAVNLILTGNHQFKNIIIDTIDNLYRLCEIYICEREGIRHPDELKYGKGFAFVRQELMNVLRPLSLSPYGLVLVSHVKVSESKTRTGEKITKATSSLTDSARKHINGFVDQIFYFGIEPTIDENGNEYQQRYILTRQNSYIEAGGRFKWLPEALPMDYPTLLEEWQKGAHMLNQEVSTNNPMAA